MVFRTTAVAALVAAAALACTRRPVQSHAIAIRNFTFQPAAITVMQGDTVVWTNTDFVPHTATARDGSWDSKSLAGSSAWQFVAQTQGRHHYYCVFHPNMEGTIEVR